MKKTVGMLLLPLLLCPLLATETASANPMTLVIAHVTVIDATGAPTRPDMTVVIIGNRITEIGKSGTIRLPRQAKVVTASGEFLIPGDMHVHWYEKDYLPLFIANGVTRIRIMWGMPMHHEWRKEIEVEQLLGPHMLIASPIVDGPKPVWPGSITVGNASEARQAVIQAKRDGARLHQGLLPSSSWCVLLRWRREGTQRGAALAYIGPSVFINPGMTPDSLDIPSSAWAKLANGVV